ncbi:hypothetical protein E4L95_06095 [Paracoccus liaowanqingii]|uniref:Peptidase inhibitor I78 n=1 Tax=Paracoccus liaowanqingii TaxID=2560053 RepID=A0A4Z1CQ53_9RHOB|nr:I78 family peptidase inhibitor [Paracoccus liaowanqingii]TGN67138.1 hypothetical protein E4L95_06095 [Paracoccus liaowanqingii]
MTLLPVTRMSMIAAPLLLALGACAGNPYDIPATQCSPAQHQALVGRNVGEVFLPPNLRKREVGPDGVMTRDYNPARLTMFLDAKGWITRVACG